LPKIEPRTFKQPSPETLKTQRADLEAGVAKAKTIDKTITRLVWRQQFCR
jgi:hypothetical protein